MPTINPDGNAVPNKKPKSEKVESLMERAKKLEPDYKEKIKSEKWEMPEFTKKKLPLYDSITRINFVFADLLQLTPTREVLRWCAHKQTFLSELFEPIKKDLEFLPSRLEGDFPHCSRKISDLIGELNAAFREHNIHLLQGPRRYLLPPESWNDLRNYEEFLRWRNKEIWWAVHEDPNIESHEEAEKMIKGLTCTYPADIIKICAEIYKNLEKPYEIISEQMKSAEKKQNGDGLTKVERLAYQSYEYAVDKNPKLADETDEKAYDWLKQNWSNADYELPTFETWVRYVREGRKAFGKQKNTSRAGRNGRSTINTNQIQSLSEISSRFDNEAD